MSPETMAVLPSAETTKRQRHCTRPRVTFSGDSHDEPALQSLDRRR